MRVGILTLPMGNNYGGILQAYALQQTLVRLGHEVWLLDRGWAERWSLYEWVSFAVYQTMSLSGRKRITKQECERRTGPELHRFVVQHFPNRVWVNAHSRDLGASTIRDLNLDAIVVGSDQIWRREYARRIGFCYLDFARNWNIRRVAYAASFGQDGWRYSKAETEECSALARMFDAVSVREEGAVALCREHLDVKAELMPDPTLLLSAYEYHSLFANGNSVTSGTSEPFGAVSYFLGWNNEVSGLVDAVVETMNLQHVQLCKSIYFGTDPSKVTVLGSVERWLGCLASAQCVLTDSFHGTVFAIINHKPFVTLANKSGGVSRIHTLLSHFGLSDHLVSSAVEALAVLREPVDWVAVDAILDTDRKRALDFLNGSLTLNSQP